MRDDLRSLRLAASRWFVPLAWLHVPAIAVFTAVHGFPVWPPAAAMALAALGATLAVWRGGDAPRTREIVGAALAMAPVAMLFAGPAVPHDLLAYAFVIVALLLAYVDWRPIGIAAGLGVGSLILSADFGGAVDTQAQIVHVVVFGALLAVEAIALMSIAWRIETSFAQAAQARLRDESHDRAPLPPSTAAVSGAALPALATAAAGLGKEPGSGSPREYAGYDAVTGLPNRLLLADRLGVAVAHAERAGTDVLVISLDLDRFGVVNDTIGHAEGDAVLTQIASRLRGCLRTGDTASRVGGDEFVVVCSTSDAVADVDSIAARICAAIGVPLQAGSQQLTLGASLGISVYPDDGAMVEELLRKADAAMHRAKRNGRGSFALFTPEIHEEMVAQAILKRELETAIERDEFVLHYQPIVSLTSGDIIGAEALVRWMHPTRGLLAPAQFIGFAEEQGLIVAIGAAVLHKACVQINRFALDRETEFTLAVNVSALQFRQQRFVDFVAAVVAEHGVPSSRLEIEITESVVVDDALATIDTMREIVALGVRLSIDDFGTGYSSLAYVKTFPAQTLKIDRSFVKDIADDPTDQAIAATIITLAHNLGMRVIAEGVETERALEQVRLLGVDDVQGYLISKPLPGPDFERFVCAAGALKLAA